MNRNYVFLLLIICLSLFLRLYKIDSVPPSASLDEASIGWNAYSILQTGRDEYGYKFPILLRAYDDWRPALYVYTVIPFVKIFGLNVFSIRLPSILFSIGTILLSYFLARNIFIKNKFKEQIGLLSALLMGISPWSIYISRLGHEVNSSIFFIILGIFLFTYFVIRKPTKWILPASIVSFSISLYTYQSVKVFAPLILICLFLIYYKTLLSYKKIFLFSLFVGFVLAIPILLASLSPQALVRFKGASAFDTDQKIYYDNFINLQKAKENGDIIGQIFYQRRVTDLKIFTSQYFSHFNPRWLFGNEGNESFKAPGVGLLNLWTAPFLFLGLSYLFKQGRKVSVLIISWILISFIPSAITTQAPHAMRSYNLLPVPQMIIAVGIVSFSGILKSSLNRKVLYLGIAVIAIAWEIFFFYQYILIFPKNQSSSFQYSMKEAVDYINEAKNKYKKIVISNADNLHQSYMFYLFYTKYDPEIYQKEGGTVSGGFSQPHNFNNLIFDKIKNPLDYEKGTLIVGNQREVNEIKKPLRKIYNLDGTESVRIVKI